MSDNTFNKLREVTTSDAIAYAPGRMVAGDPKAMDKAVAKVKRFREKLFDAKLNEDASAELAQVHRSIVLEFSKLINSSPLVANMSEFIRLFHVKRNLTGIDVMLRPNSKADLDNLLKGLPTELGECQLILSKLRARKSDFNFDYLNLFDYIYGCKLSASIYGFVFFYEGYIDRKFNIYDAILVEDKDLLSEINKSMAEIKVEGSRVTSNSGVLTNFIIREIFEVMDQLDEEQDKLRNNTK